MTYQEALKKAGTFISNELTPARSTLDTPSTLNIFYGENELTISILKEDYDAKT